MSKRGAREPRAPITTGRGLKYCIRTSQAVWSNLSKYLAAARWAMPRKLWASWP